MIAALDAAGAPSHPVSVTAKVTSVLSARTGILYVMDNNMKLVFLFQTDVIEWCSVVT